MKQLLYSATALAATLAMFPVIWGAWLRPHAADEDSIIYLW